MEKDNYIAPKAKETLLQMAKVLCISPYDENAETEDIDTLESFDELW